MVPKRLSCKKSCFLKSTWVKKSSIFHLYNEKSPNVTVRSCKILFIEIRPLTEDIVESHELLDDVITISKTAEKSCQIDEAEKEKNDLPIVVVGSGCACAVFRGADIFAPGIMGATLTMNKNDKVLVYADLSNKLLKGMKNTNF